jgi:hypothetical protein
MAINYYPMTKEQSDIFLSGMDESKLTYRLMRTQFIPISRNKRLQLNIETVALVKKWIADLRLNVKEMHRVMVGLVSCEFLTAARVTKGQIDLETVLFECMQVWVDKSCNKC